MKSFIAILCLVVVACAAVEARPKRSVVYATVPVVGAGQIVSSSVVQHSPTTVVKTEQVQGVGHSSYQYSTEVKSNPVVHTTHTVAAAAPAAVVSAPLVSAVHHTVPTYAYNYPYAYSYPYAAYSPYHYVVGK